ncbi:MAG TPA: GGDEF domain-containing protein [Syntrophales bacterium]|nr:GGDEF domain-containing protein [Syntrophales bacterium]
MDTVMIFSNDPDFQIMAERMLKDHYRTVPFSDLKLALDCIYNDTPSLVVMEIASGDDSSVSLLNLIKGDPLFSSLPVLVVFAGNIEPQSFENMLFEDYIRKADSERDILPRVNLGVMRCERVVEISPLTRLPGNLSITKQIQMRLDQGEVFALAYADLDNFKPFNDRYGFGRGDELIKMTGRIILNIVKDIQPQGYFVGHIGGDDFVIIMKPGLIARAAKTIIEQFDTMVAGFYDPADWDAGYIFAADRKGIWTKLPVTSISIGITDTERRTFSHHGELMQRASEMKAYAKKFAGSCYKLDQREKKDTAH